MEAPGHVSSVPSPKSGTDSASLALPYMANSAKVYCVIPRRRVITLMRPFTRKYKLRFPYLIFVVFLRYDVVVGANAHSLVEHAQTSSYKFELGDGGVDRNEPTVLQPAARMDHIPVNHLHRHHLASKEIVMIGCRFVRHVGRGAISC